MNVEELEDLPEESEDPAVLATAEYDDPLSHLEKLEDRGDFQFSFVTELKRLINSH